LESLEGADFGAVGGLLREEGQQFGDVDQLPTVQQIHHVEAVGQRRSLQRHHPLHFGGDATHRCVSAAYF
jgi:hypothetical protein